MLQTCVVCELYEVEDADEEVCELCSLDEE